MPEQGIFEKCAACESKLEKLLISGSKETKKIRSLIKELEGLKEKYQKAKKKNDASGMHKYYSNACSSSEKIKELLNKQNDNLNSISTCFKEDFYRELNSKFESGIKDCIKDFFGIQT